MSCFLCPHPPTLAVSQARPSIAIVVCFLEGLILLLPVLPGLEFLLPPPHFLSPVLRCHFLSFFFEIVLSGLPQLLCSLPYGRGQETVLQSLVQTVYRPVRGWKAL